MKLKAYWAWKQQFYNKLRKLNQSIFNNSKEDFNNNNENDFDKTKIKFTISSVFSEGIYTLIVIRIQ